MSANLADTPTTPMTLSATELRTAVSVMVLSALPVLGSPANQSIKNARRPASTFDNELARRAALYALDNFRQLQDSDGSAASSPPHISEKKLYDLLLRGQSSPAGRPLLSFLHRHIAAIGHAVGTRESTTHVSAGACALPITFKSTVYAIDAFDLIECICKQANPVSK